MAQSAQKLSVVEKVGYSLGDTAANFVFQALMVFQLSFYADTFGIGAQAAGTMFLVVRILDAIFDPIVGAIADRTNSRWGKFRPWILWTAVPFGVIGYFTFVTPDFGATGKLVYAYVTYILLNLIYSLNNCPYSALSGVMTSDIGERTSLSSYRFVFAMLGAFAIQGIGPEMLRYFGSSSDGTTNLARGYQVTMGIFAALSVLFFLVTFASTKERIVPDPSHTSSVGQDLKDLSRNGPWIALFGLTIFLFIGLVMRGNVMPFYFKYYLNLDQEKIWGYDAFGLFNGLGLGASIVGILFSKPAAMKYGKRNVFIFGLGLTTLLTVGFVALPAGQVLLIFGVEIVRQFFYGFTIPLLWAMMADVADYSEWKNGRRATGIVFSAVVFGLKAGLGFGGFIGGSILAGYGYVPNMVQTERALEGIKLAASVFPAVPFILGVICLFCYGITKELNIQIAEELNIRRLKAQSSPPVSELEATAAP